MQIKTFGPYTFPLGSFINTPWMMDDIANSLLKDGWECFDISSHSVKRYFQRSLQMYFHCKSRQ